MCIVYGFNLLTCISFLFLLYISCILNEQFLFSQQQQQRKKSKKKREIEGNSRCWSKRTGNWFDWSWEMYLKLMFWLDLFYPFDSKFSDYFQSQANWQTTRIPYPWHKSRRFKKIKIAEIIKSEKTVILSEMHFYHFITNFKTKNAIRRTLSTHWSCD